MKIEQRSTGDARDDVAASSVTSANGALRQRLAWTTPSLMTVDVAALTMGATGPVSDGITVES